MAIYASLLSNVSLKGTVSQHQAAHEGPVWAVRVDPHQRADYGAQIADSAQGAMLAPNLSFLCNTLLILLFVHEDLR